MKINNIVLLLAMMSVTAVAEAAANLIDAPHELTVELLPSPCGVDVATPRLGWKLGGAANAKEVLQTGYQILVSTTLDKLTNDEGDLWNSGKVTGAQSIGIVYGGKALSSSQHVFWKVRTWNSSGKMSAWSEPQTFVTGIMNAADWKAKWIGPAACTRPDEDFGAAKWITAAAGTNGVTTLEFTFDFDGVNRGQYVEMVHAGVSQHEIDVNGLQFNKWSGHVHDWRYLRFRDMTPWLIKGNNKIVVRIFADVPRTASDHLDPIRKHAPADVRAFIAKITMPDGKLLVTSKNGWTSPNGEVSELGGIREPSWGTDMVLRAENVSPAFAKTFEIVKPIASALLHVTGVGFYEASLNGDKIGDRVLDPSPTAFDKRVLYSTYDIGKCVKLGKNELKILVGHGWYDMQSIATWNFEISPWRDFPRTIAQLELVYTDGTKQTIVTDRSWRQVKSPLGHDDIFEGEVKGGWEPNMPDLEKNVVMAEEVAPPCKMLVSEMHEPAKVMRTFSVKGIHAMGGGTYVIDAGENVSGWLRMNIRGQKQGDVVSLRYDERVNEDFSPAAPSVRDGLHDFKFSNELKAAAKGKECRNVDHHFRYTASHRSCATDAAFQTDRVVCSGADEIYEPRFAYNGFRYVIIKGLAQEPKIEDITVCVVHTAFPTIGSFECSDSTFNKLMEMGEKAYRGNFTDGVPTDCPHREKNGWTGDASIASELAQYIFENTATYEKWLRDIADAQLDNGNIPGIVPTSGWGFRWGNGPAWDSALSVITWNLWIYRGDRHILDEMYPIIVKYLEYTATRANADGLVKHGLGDWVPVNRKHMPSVELTSSCYYYQALTIASKIAAIKGMDEASAEYAAKAEKVKNGINKKFYKGSGVYDNGYQSAQAFPIAYGIVPESEFEQVAKKLVEAVVDKADCHVDVGLLGTKHVFRALSRIGRSDLAFKMLVNPTKPSPVEWIQKGGTTLWEDWSNGSSRNHIMFGDFVGWAYQYLAGIGMREAEGSCSAVTVPTSPAFKELVIAPQVVEGLTWVEASVNGPYGEILSSWKRQGLAFTLKVTIPPNTTAKVVLPDGSSQMVGSGSYTFNTTIDKSKLYK